MNKVSVKGVLVGGVTDIVAAVILPLPLIVYLIATEVTGTPKEPLQAAIMTAIHANPLLYGLESLIGLACSRVPPGTEGADIIHEIIENGKRCGTILYECKNSTLFREDWVTKLHTDQIAKEAQHAILSTYKLPAGADDQVDIRDGVIIAKPERVPVVAEILRKDAIENHKIGLSAKGQAQKTEALYAYITSPSFNQRLGVIESLTKKNARAPGHGGESAFKTLEKREALIKSIEDARNVLHAEIDQIIDENDGGEL